MTYSEFKVPKRNGQLRTLVAPDKELKQYQRSKLKGLNKLLEDNVRNAFVSTTIHGFRKQKSCVTAASLHVGYKATLMMDIANFFGAINVTHFDNILKIDPLLFHKDGYLAQGFPTSPVLANLALVPILAELKYKLSQITRVVKVTCYADDIAISVDNTDKIPQIVSLVEEVLLKYSLRLNKAKTRVKYAKYGYRRILGINVGDSAIRATRKTIRKIRAASHQGNGPSLGGLTNWAACRKPKVK